MKKLLVLVLLCAISISTIFGNTKLSSTFTIASIEPQPSIKLEKVEDLFSAILILKQSIFDYNKAKRGTAGSDQQEGAVMHSDYRSILYKRSSINSFEYHFSLCFNPKWNLALTISNAITYRAIYYPDKKEIHIYELERARHFLNGKASDIAKPSRYLRNHNINFNSFGKPETRLAETETEFKLMLETNRDNTKWLESEKVEVIKQESLVNKLVEDSKLNLATLTELDNVCLKYYGIYATNPPVLKQELLRGFVQTLKPEQKKMLIEVTNSRTKVGDVDYGKENFVKGGKITLNFSKEVVISQDFDHIIIWDKCD